LQKIKIMLKSFHKSNCIEVGLDEVGRGSFAGPVVTAAVILPADFKSELINDSKKLTDKQRRFAAEIIYKHALAYSVQAGSVKLINRTNINEATFITMHKCLDDLSIVPEHILVDGNVFNQYEDIPHTCVEKGDGTYLSIAAASIIAKVQRDDYMKKLHEIYPNYGWNTNAGYHSKIHAQGLKEYGATPYHRTLYIRNFI
jgi:ribonuclease HII